MKYKSFLSFFASFAVLLILFTANAQSNELMDFDFENITKTAKVYIADEPLISTYSTNNGIKSYDFVFENNSRKLMFTSYGTDEVTGNASRKFEFYFREEYSLEAFPDTKLVIMYDEAQKAFDCDHHYTHFLIQDGSTNICQMFIMPVNNLPCYKPANKSYSQYLDFNNEKSLRFVVDLKQNGYIFQAGDVKSGLITSVGESTSSIDKVAFYPTTGQKYSIDNLRAVVVPNNFEVTDYSGKDGKKIDVDDTVYVCFTAPLEENIQSYVTVEKNGTLIDKSEYTLSLCDDDDSKIKIAFKNPMSYNTNYTVTLKKGLSDIAYNAFGSDKTVTFTTENKPQFSLFTTVNTATDGISFNLTAENCSSKSEECEVITLVYKNGNLSGVSSYEKTFSASEKDTSTSFFKSGNSGIALKSYVIKKGTSDILCEDEKNLN